MDRLIFGDNQFFGVNHMSEEKARSQALQFQDDDSIIAVLDVAYAAGLRTFMCTTHERMAHICQHIRNHPDRYEGFQLYPCMPYAHKYANAVTELGMMGALRNMLPNDGLFDAVLRGGKSLASKDIEGIITLLVDSEMKMFHNLETPVIFLQNVVVDLLLGLGFDQAFSIFDAHVRKRYGAEPGFITMNLPKLVESLNRIGLQNPIVCSNINKLGFRMSGGIGAYERILREGTFQPMAMSVFASGAIAPREALEWVRNLDTIGSVVFGASSESHIRSTARLVDELWSREAVH